MNYGPASKYYDLFASKDDIDFYKGLAVKYGRKALELGVGTGRVAIELAKADVTVWGIDNSKYMLDVAREKLQEEQSTVRERVTLKLGDMRSLEVKEKFPFIYIPSSTFEHCTTEEDKERCLTNVYRALKEKGVLAFDISQPQEKLESSWWIDQRRLSEEEEVVRTIFSRRNPENHVISVNLFFEVYLKGELKEKYYELGKARIWTKQNIENALRTIGFNIRHVYGDYNKSAYDKKSRRAIFVAHKA